MAWLDRIHHPETYIKTFLKWALLGVVMGIIGGLLGAGFHHVLHYLTHLRGEHTWLIFLLPVGGVLTVALYRVLKMQGNRGTNEIIDATLDGHSVSPAVAPAIFLATAMTHLFGGSAGREGAALQLGGSTASLLAKLFRLNDKERRVMVMAGMSAVFAGLFGTPLTATLFCMEFESVGTLFTPALLPCYLAAFIASRVSGLLGVHAETYLLETAYSLTLGNCWKFLILAVLVSCLGIAMCFLFHKAEHLAAHYLPNPFVRIAAGGVAVMVLTLLVGDHRFNGAGMDMALKAVGGEADWYSFLMKMLFTAVTLSAGFKGGEIVPTFCIGATFGCVLGGLLGLDAGLAAALGLVGLFCCATNSPLASIVLSMEMFGGANLYLFALVCVICFVLSGNSGLYASQIIEFSKSEIPGSRQSR
ncbi:MAG: chloride channel protein [Oscillospiraceae bacterium]|nr:chloride channel protein [Oscillospiraceae bacterium]MBQ7129732.1 chloride channel protein [Oscillospiraceae bacterium]